MKDWQQYRYVKVDIHQTMVQAEHSPDLGAPTPGAISFIKNVLAMPGWGVVLSCGGFDGGTAAEDKSFEDKTRKWLQSYDIDPKRIVFLPDMRYIIDISDRAITFRGDWGAMWTETKSRAAQLERTKSPDGPKPTPRTIAGRAEGPGAPPPLRGGTASDNGNAANAQV